MWSLSLEALETPLPAFTYCSEALWVLWDHLLCNFPTACGMAVLYFWYKDIQSWAFWSCMTLEDRVLSGSLSQTSALYEHC